MLLGIGAAPEGVLASAALACIGGYMEGKLKFRDKADKNRAKNMGFKDYDKILKVKDMVDCEKTIFAATGVTDGTLLKGAQFTAEGASTHSIVMRSKTKTVRFIEAHHVFEDEPKY